MASAAITKTKAKERKRVAVNLREQLDLTESKVDRKNCIIRDVKILGRSSHNKHGMPGVTGTDYLPSAHEQARDFYEGLQVNIGHPPKTDPAQERQPIDRNGVLKDVTIRNGQTYGNWHLIPSHAMTPTFMDCAENPVLHTQFALSHNAKGYGEVREGRYQISSIPLVRSVDVVTNGGCNSSLFEGREHMADKLPFCEILESAKADVQAKFQTLLEEMGDLGDMPTSAPPAADPSYEAHCAEMVKAIIMHADLTAEEKIEKIKTALKILGEEKPAEGDATEGDDEPDADDMDKKDKAGQASESSDGAKNDAAELAQYRAEKKARNLCESLEFTPSPIQLKLLTKLDTDTERKTAIKEFKTAVAPGKKSTAPRTGGTRNVFESAEKKKTTAKKESFLADIKG